MGSVTDDGHCTICSMSSDHEDMDLDLDLDLRVGDLYLDLKANDLDLDSDLRSEDLTATLDGAQRARVSPHGSHALSLRGCNDFLVLN
jgi:hypothetical protein